MDYLKENFSEILKYAEMSSFAYKSDKEILNKYPKAKIQNLVDLDLKSFIITDDNNKIQHISVKGTSSLKNIFLDADYIKVYNKSLGIWVHRGFNTSANKLYDLIKSHLKIGYTIKCTGHSLGGAISVLIMLMLKRDGFILGNGITYGQPKFTNRKGMKKYRDLPLIRVVHEQDPVHFLPPFTLGSFFNHGVYRSFGRKLLINDDGSYKYFSEKESEGIRFNSFWIHLPEEELKEHFIKIYINTSRKILNKL